MSFIKELTLWLGDTDQPVITEYQLAAVYLNLYLKHSFRANPSRGSFQRYVKGLINNGILTEYRNVSKAYSITGKRGDSWDILCSIDPFAYISHLSAMSYHGLSDRVPNTIFASTPRATEWSKFARNKMEKDLDVHFNLFEEARLPKLVRIRFDKIGKNPVSIYSSSHLGAFKHVSGRPLRVSTIGRTFLDMVREPALCGGMVHVLEIYRSFGQNNKKLIISEVTQHANKIEKMRVGYLLEEIAGVRDSALDEWAKDAMRGGSRKLDPTQEFSPIFSEKWALSLNIPSIEGD